MRILLTGARAPCTLELARAFSRAGHEVYTADCLVNVLCRHSRSVKKHLVVPAPQFDCNQFARVLTDHLVKYNIDLLIPTCEEVLYIAKVRALLPSTCDVFVDTLEKLERLHNKAAFIELCKQENLSHPKSLVAKSSKDLEKFLRHSNPAIIKPIYSRFGCKNRILTHANEIKNLTITPGNPYLIQEFIKGREYATYTIAKQGKMCAHVTYICDYKYQNGVGVSFQSVTHNKLRKLIEKFVKSQSFTGQLAFDAIEDHSGVLHFLECNPRATSGTHLIPHSDLSAAFMSFKSRKKISQNKPRAQLSLMMLPALLKCRTLSQATQWFRNFISTSDVIFDAQDLKPFFLQALPYLDMTRLAKRQDVSLQEACTFGIEWNATQTNLKPVAHMKP